MKKQLFICLTIFVAISLSFAGDAAAFVDFGLSSDGKTYVFAEYGKTDKTFQGYAGIYCVDIEKNDWISGEVFRTPPSVATAKKSGKQVYEELLKKAEWTLKKYNIKKSSPDNLLFTRENSSSNGEIVFKDFEGSTVEKSVFYHIKLEKNVEGKGSSCHSSFFIVLEKQDELGNVISRNIVGNPDIRRKGVTNYTINRIFSDKSGRNLVFVIEKQIEDETGTCIRYMVETIRI
ncbi:DUF2259 domain-containing protein [Treponema pectinovorum]|uniref:DUF2259 domain-containing protein n=1 Tax=Treponema pectinovorum TaxID=164 RepID=UPI003D9418F0